MYPGYYYIMNRIQTYLKNTKNGRHKQRSGQQTLARHKNIQQTNYYLMTMYYMFPLIVPKWPIFHFEERRLNVVGNEKGGGSGNKLLLEYGFGPWRSMSV